jgi:hypothetical protein
MVVITGIIHRLPISVTIVSPTLAEAGGAKPAPKPRKSLVAQVIAKKKAMEATPDAMPIKIAAGSHFRR